MIAVIDDDIDIAELVERSMSAAVIENSEIASIYQSLSTDQRRALAIYCVSEIDRRRGDDAEAVARATMGVRRWKRALKTIPQPMLDAGSAYLASFLATKR